MSSSPSRRTIPRQSRSRALSFNSPIALEREALPRGPACAGLTNVNVFLPRIEPAPPTLLRGEAGPCIHPLAARVGRGWIVFTPAEHAALSQPVPSTPPTAATPSKVRVKRSRTDEQRIADAENYAERLAAMTPKQREAQRAKQRECMRRKRAQERQKAERPGRPSSGARD